MFSGTALVCHRGRRVVFSGVDFLVTGGGTLCLTGANGSGKSSLLRLMAGLLRPMSGTIAWDGQDIARHGDAHNARLCLITQDDPVKPELAVFEQLSFWARLAGADATREKLRGVLAQVGLERQEGVQGRFLSAGQRRRLNLGRLFLKDYPLWLLDEPMTALDAASCLSFQGHLDRRAGQGGMTVIATHDAGTGGTGMQRLAL